LPPDVLQRFYGETIAEFWDSSAYEEVLERERTEAERLGEAS
jgi:hypothetical protein